MSYRSFYYSLPTEILFGADSMDRLRSRLEGIREVAVLFSSDFIKRIGLHGDLAAILNEAGINRVEFGNCRPNPGMDSIESIAADLRGRSIDAMIAVGGGSVIDAAKAVSLALANGEEFPQRFIDNNLLPAAIPLIAISTVPASGSEANSSFVINMGGPYGKIARAHASVRPKHAVLNPRYLKSLSDFQLAASLSDIVSHLLEQLFVAETETSYLDDLIIASIGNAVEQAKCVSDGRRDDDVLANIMLNASLSLSYLFSLGRRGDWNCHALEHALSAEYGTSHGAGLALIYPEYLKYTVGNRQYEAKLLVLGRRVFGLKGDDGARSAIERLSDFFQSLGLPRRFQDLAKAALDVDRIAETVMQGRPSIGSCFKMNPDTAVAVLRAIA